MGQKIRILGVPMDLGASRRGVDMGPSALRVAGLQARLKQLGYQVEDLGNISVKQPEEQHYGDKRAKYLKEISETCQGLADAVERTLADEMMPLVLGGDHSIAAGSAAGVASFYKKQSKRVGFIWLDAHGDMNTPETSPSGNVHGMPLAVALGLAGPEFESDAWRLPAVSADRVALVGVRSLDPAETELIAETGVSVYTMSDVDRLGLERVVREALAKIAGPGFVHVSLDMDALEPDIAPGVGTPVRGGLSYREAHLAMELVAESGIAGSLEVVEVNPILDRENETAALAVELVASALGATIL